MEKTLKAFLARKKRLDQGKHDAEAYGNGVCREEESYDTEFEKIRIKSLEYREEGKYPSTHGEKLHNIKKNRYKDILPYDYTRVILSDKDGKLGSNYINANFMKGTQGHDCYIAAQGPLPGTVDDFWRMLWENKIRTVLMACSEYEGYPRKLKCQRYWPQKNEELRFGDVSVKLSNKTKSEQNDYTIRTISAECGSEERTITQFHYHSWPDHGTPESVMPILDMIAMARDFQPADNPPIVVHCSAGCGRTGTIIALDYIWSLLKYGRLSSSFSIYNLLVELRKQRPAMVQSNDQYVFVYQAVSELFDRHLDIVKKHNYENVTLKEKKSSGMVQSSEEEGQDLVQLTDRAYEDVDPDQDTSTCSPGRSWSQATSPTEKALVSALVSSYQQRSSPKPTPSTKPTNTKQPLATSHSQSPPPTPSIQTKPSLLKLQSESDESRLKPAPLSPKPTGDNAPKKQSSYENMPVKERKERPKGKHTTQLNPKGKIGPDQSNSSVTAVASPDCQGLTISDEYSQPCPLTAKPDDQNMYAEPYNSLNSVTRPKNPLPVSVVQNSEHGGEGLYSLAAGSDGSDAEEDFGASGEKYSYADPYRDDKWPLQHIARSKKQVTGGAEYSEVELPDDEKEQQPPCPLPSNYEQVEYADTVAPAPCAQEYTQVEFKSSRDVPSAKGRVRSHHEEKEQRISLSDDMESDDEVAPAIPRKPRNLLEEDNISLNSKMNAGKFETLGRLFGKLKSSPGIRGRTQPGTNAGPYSGKAVQVKFKDHDISFPNRVDKPRGQRVMKLKK